MGAVLMGVGHFSHLGRFVSGFDVVDAGMYLLIILMMTDLILLLHLYCSYVACTVVLGYASLVGAYTSSPWSIPCHD